MAFEDERFNFGLSFPHISYRRPKRANDGQRLGVDQKYPKGQISRHWIRKLQRLRAMDRLFHPRKDGHACNRPPASQEKFPAFQVSSGSMSTGATRYTVSSCVDLVFESSFSSTPPQTRSREGQLLRPRYQDGLDQETVGTKEKASGGG